MSENYPDRVCWGNYKRNRDKRIKSSSNIISRNYITVIWSFCNHSIFFICFCLLLFFRWFGYVDWRMNKPESFGPVGENSTLCHALLFWVEKKGSKRILRGWKMIPRAGGLQQAKVWWTSRDKAGNHIYQSLRSGRIWHKVNF